MPSRATEMKYLRRILGENASEFIDVSGMDFYHDRFFYKYTTDAIYFSEIGVSGSWRGENWKGLSCTLHIYYKNFPGYKEPPIHESGNPIPTYRQSRLSFGMDRTLDQAAIIENLDNTSLNYDKSIWHVLNDESNISEVVVNLSEVIRDVGLPLVQREIYSREKMLEK